MKKYILMLAVAAAATLVACGNKQATEEAAEAVDTVAVEEVVEEVVDTTAVDTTAVDTTVVAPAAL